MKSIAKTVRKLRVKSIQKTDSKNKSQGTQNGLNQEIRQNNTGRYDEKYITIWHRRVDRLGLNRTNNE